MKSTFLISALFAAVVSLGSSSAIHPTPMDDEPSRDMPIRRRLGNVRVQHVREDDLEVIHNFLPSDFSASLDVLFKDMTFGPTKQLLNGVPKDGAYNGIDVHLPKKVARKLTEYIGSQDKPDSIHAQTLKLTKTTPQHVDVYDGMDDDEDITIFIFMNDNDNAHFNYDGKIVPITKGSLVRFNGKRLHNTVVEKGHVNLLGPFEGKYLGRMLFCFSGTPPTKEPLPTESPTDPLITSKAGKISKSSKTAGPTDTFGKATKEPLAKSSKTDSPTGDTLKE